MNFFYPRPAGDGESLVVVRLIVGSLMLASIVLAVIAIRRRDFTSHGAGMTRGYAIALGARDPGVHYVAVGAHLRPDWRGRRDAPHGAHDGGLGDQSRGGRIRHSPSNGQAGISRSSVRKRAVRLGSMKLAASALDGALYLVDYGAVRDFGQSDPNTKFTNSA
jgi:hypothetical protein